MKTLLVAINAKFIHSNLAIRYLYNYVQNKENLKIKEYTINNQLDDVVADIYEEKADVICISTYIWNVDYIKDVIADIKKVSNAKIVLGGPEVSYNSEAFLKDNENADIIIRGEGEKIFSNLYEKDFSNLATIKGITYRKNNQIISNEDENIINMDEVPFVYEGTLPEFENRIIYYESSRGCPYNCAYCLSSLEKRLRFRSLDIVKKDLKYFLDNEVPQVKFVDRTFNADKARALELWKFLKENDNGVTNFHFEIAADILTDEQIEFLKTTRDTLFQFEIGIQTTNEKVLDVIKRKMDFGKVKNNVVKLLEKDNINIHLDLIAALPKEDYNSFKKSFNDVYNIKPHHVQLGFLKLIKGSHLEVNKEDLKLVSRDVAPYEVLYSNEITYDELLKLKCIEDLVEKYYNSKRYYNAVNLLETLFETPFELYEKFAEFYKKEAYNKAPNNKVKMYTILLNFYKSITNENEELFKQLLKFDMHSFEKVKKLPEWLEYISTIEMQKIVYNNEDYLIANFKNFESYDKKYLNKNIHIEQFSYNIPKFIEEKKIVKEENYIIFDYKNKKKVTNVARYISVGDEVYDKKED